jgi:asparagine synthase (glutamine-hydrolysing)
MCGIFALLNNSGFSIETTNSQFIKGKNRGPEYSKLKSFSNFNLNLGFHRLAINGLNEKSNQPLSFQNIFLVCNGEIYNYKYLYELMDIKPETDSDCEVIIHLYLRYGIDQTLQMLDGVFAFILYDSNNSNIYVARDPFGVRPLYQLSNLTNYCLIGFASELKCLNEFVNIDEAIITSENTNINQNKITQFTPGTYSVFSYNNYIWSSIKENIPYIVPTFSYQNNKIEWVSYYTKIADNLVKSVEKRCLTTERPIACLLSGGLDSSLITALVNDFYISSSFDKKLETYSIGLAGSEDLKYARIVANYLNTKHTQIIVTEKEMFDAIPEVICAIESYDTTTIRASIGNYLLGKYISKNSDAKVIFNGDGADELCGGYLYMKSCPDSIEFDKETRRLLKDIHLFDVLRSDKSISSHGLEPRTPFLDRNFVNYYLSIPPYVRNYNNFSQCEKYLIRKSFSSPIFETAMGKQILPDEILWRKKEAFSDGVTGLGRSLFQILQEFISTELNLPATIETEKLYYKNIFDKYYPKMSHIVPYLWMPKYTNATDPSARTLENYDNKLFQSTEKKALK